MSAPQYNPKHEPQHPIDPGAKKKEKHERERDQRHERDPQRDHDRDDDPRRDDEENRVLGGEG